ncbi:hypothetical protein PVAP13_7NG195617 [Panicum virgatum]|uniref:Uncharacterized protein n=1 Tax=Panicum virgatum TaxID=38727 RepID=A0A8T0Q1A3_PANVG|nr:hypothetical protein PVAP13_7NG195617 [Panicum virgatum]
MDQNIHHFTGLGCGVLCVCHPIWAWLYFCPTFSPRYRTSARTTAHIQRRCSPRLRTVSFSLPRRSPSQPPPTCSGGKVRNLTADQLLLGPHLLTHLSLEALPPSTARLGFGFRTVRAFLLDSPVIS